MNRFVYQADDLGAVSGLRKSLRGKLSLLDLGQKCDTREMLPQSIMQILPDAPLLSAAHFKNRPFQTFFSVMSIPVAMI